MTPFRDQKGHESVESAPSRSAF